MSNYDEDYDEDYDEEETSYFDIMSKQTDVEFVQYIANYVMKHGYPKYLFSKEDFIEKVTEYINDNYNLIVRHL